MKTAKELLREEIQKTYESFYSAKLNAEKVIADRVLEVEELKSIIESDGVTKFTVTSEKSYDWKTKDFNYSFRLNLSIKKADGKWDENFYVEIKKDDFYINWFGSSANKVDIGYLNYLSIVGRIAEFLKNEDKFNKLLSVVNSNNVELDFAFMVEDTIREMENEIRKIEKIESDEKVKSVEDKLVVGNVIELIEDNTFFKYEITRSQKVEKITIIKVTPKYVFFTISGENISEYTERDEQKLQKDAFVGGIINWVK